MNYEFRIAKTMTSTEIAAAIATIDAELRSLFGATDVVELKHKFALRAERERLEVALDAARDAKLDAEEALARSEASKRGAATRKARKDAFRLSGM